MSLKFERLVMLAEAEKQLLSRSFRFRQGSLHFSYAVLWSLDFNEAANRWAFLRVSGHPVSVLIVNLLSLLAKC